MGKASDFLKKMKFVEDMDSEMDADKAKGKELEEDDQLTATPSAPNIDVDDDQILAVMNGYFKHINTLDDGKKSDELQDLCHRMANTMLNMPGGEKALRTALKGAVSGLMPAPAAEPAPIMGEGKRKRKNESLSKKWNWYLDELCHIELAINHEELTLSIAGDGQTKVETIAQLSPEQETAVAKIADQHQSQISSSLKGFFSDLNKAMEVSESRKVAGKLKRRNEGLDKSEISHLLSKIEEVSETLNVIQAVDEFGAEQLRDNGDSQSAKQFSDAMGKAYSIMKTKG